MSDLSPPSPPSPPLSDRRRRGHRDDESALVYHQGDHHGVYQHHREDEHRDSAEEEDDDDEQQPRSASAAQQQQQQQQQHALPHNRGPTRSATPPRHTSTGAYQSTSPAQNAANGKERSLMDLLAKAASEIRVERRKVRQLLDDNERLKGEVTSLKGRQAQAVRHQQSSSANKEIAELKNKYSDLMTAHKAMSVELEQCKEQLQTWQSRCKEQQRVLLQNQQQQGAAAAPRSRAGSPTTQTNLAYAQRNGGRTAGATAGGSAGARQPAGASSQQQHHNPTAQYGRADSQAQQQQQRGGAAVSSSRRSASAHVPFDAMASQGLARSPPRVMGTAAAVTGGHSTATMANRSSRSRSQQQHADPSTAATSRPAQHAARAASPSHNSSLDSGAPQQQQQQQQSQLQPQREAVLAAEERQFNDLMLSRLRRAIAPAPTKEQMSEVVHAMVQELVKSAARNGLHLELKRVGNSAYQCGRRRLNLTVDSRRLVVKCGGGHVDMNEFVQRNRLWTAMENPNN